MKKILLLSLFIAPAILLASSGESGTSTYFLQTGRENDFWQRVFNFSIFVSVLYYLLANPIKNFFKNRSADIAAQLNEIEDKLQAAKDEKKEAQVRLDESSKKAEQIMFDVKKEAALLADKIAKANANDLTMMEKSLTKKINAQERKSVRAAINEVLSDNITNEDIMIDESKVVDIISKKVA